MKKLNPIYFYISYFILNLINTYILMFAIFHPNISSYSFDLNSFLFSLIGNVGVLTLFYTISIVLFKSSKARTNFLCIISFFFMVMCIGLAIYTNIFSVFFSISHLQSFGNPAQGSFIRYYASYSLHMIADFTQMIHLLVYLFLLLIRSITYNYEIKYHNPLTKTLLLTLSLVFMIIPIINTESKITKTINKSSLSAQYGIQNIGVYDYYLYDAFNFLFGKTRLDDTDLDKISDYLEESEKLTYINPIDMKEYSVINEFTNLASDMNLVMIQLEAINNFVINLEVDGVEITPNLNKLVSKSLYYNRFYSSAGIGNTSDSEFSALTGLSGNGSELTIFNYTGSNYNTLAKDFNKKGYVTFSAHGNTGRFYFRSQEHLRTLGFQTHYDLDYFKESNPNVPLIHSYLDDKYFLDKFVDIMPSDKNFFAYGITVTSHSPYVPTSEIPKHNFKGLSSLASSYLDFVMYVDEAIGIFIDSLAENNLLDNTVVVLFGDHTSSLFKNDLEGILDTKLDPISQRLLLQSTPLIIYNEALFTTKLNNKVVSTIDFYRSFSNLFGLDSKYHFNNDIFTDEPGFVYSPRNLDIIFNEFVIEYPSKKANRPISNINKYITLFENKKYVNDAILKTKYFE